MAVFVVCSVAVFLWDLSLLKGSLTAKLSLVNLFPFFFFAFSGDQILKVNNQILLDVSLQDAKSMFKVRCTLPFDVTLKTPHACL